MLCFQNLQPRHLGAQIEKLGVKVCRRPNSVIVLISIGHLHLLLSVECWLLSLEWSIIFANADRSLFNTWCLSFWCPFHNTQHQKDRHQVFERDRAAFAKIVDHSKLNSRLNWGDLYDQFSKNRKRIFTLIMTKVFTGAPILCGNWLWAQFGCADHLALIACFVCPTRSGCRAKSVRLRLAHLRRSSTLTAESYSHFQRTVLQEVIISELSANILIAETHCIRIPCTTVIRVFGQNPCLKVQRVHQFLIFIVCGFAWRGELYWCDHLKP